MIISPSRTHSRYYNPFSKQKPKIHRRHRAYPSTSFRLWWISYLFITLLILYKQTTLAVIFHASYAHIISLNSLTRPDTFHLNVYFYLRKMSTNWRTFEGIDSWRTDWLMTWTYDFWVLFVNVTWTIAVIDECGLSLSVC